MTTHAGVAAAAPHDALLADVLRANERAAAGFDRPLALGAKRKLAIVTCMDSRLLIDRMLPGVDIGDVEIIRNAGGRVTLDVIRSLFVSQEVPELATRAVLVVHHTDCGAQAAQHHHDHLVARMRQLLTEWGPLGWLVQCVVSGWSNLFLPSFLRRALLGAVMRTFSDPADALRTDLWLLRHAPLMPASIPVHGLVYDVATGRLHHVLSA